jgi:hypothetical protein
MVGPTEWSRDEQLIIRVALTWLRLRNARAALDLRGESSGEIAHAVQDAESCLDMILGKRP